MLNARKFGLAAGITWGLGVLLVGLLSNTFGWGEIVALVGTAYKGYDTTLIGSLIGAAWGFVDALVGGYVFAWIYNKL